MRLVKQCRVILFYFRVETHVIAYNQRRCRSLLVGWHGSGDLTRTTWYVKWCVSGVAFESANETNWRRRVILVRVHMNPFALNSSTTTRPETVWETATREIMSRSKGSLFGQECSVFNLQATTTTTGLRSWSWGVEFAMWGDPSVVNISNTHLHSSRVSFFFAVLTVITATTVSYQTAAEEVYSYNPGWMEIPIRWWWSSLFNVTTLICRWVLIFRIIKFLCYCFCYAFHVHTERERQTYNHNI